MSTNTKNKPAGYRKTEGIALLLVTIILFIGFLNLNRARNEQFKSIEKGYENKTVVNLDKNFSVDDLTYLLIKGNYISQEQDARIIAEHLSKRLNSGAELPNMGMLNKKPFFMNAAFIDSVGGENLKGRLEKSRKLLQIPAGIDLLNIATRDSVVSVGSGQYEISVAIYQKSKSDIKTKILKRLHLKKDSPVTESMLVQLKEYWQLTPDSLATNPTAENDSVVAYAKTGATGKATFTGLYKNKYYSVLPIKKNHEYGYDKGPTDGKGLQENAKYEFTENEHQIRPFDSNVYQQLKADNVLTVRTPQAYKDTFISYLLWFFAAWWLLHLILTFRRKPHDQLLLPLLMTLTGIGTLVMYAIHDPLTDTMEGNGMVVGTLIGLAACFIFSLIHIDKFYNDKYLIKFDYLHNLKKSIIPKGSLYLAIGIALLVLMWFIGEGPEGSGVKVNLRLGFLFQPSEIIKFLVIIFFAAYFSTNAEMIKKTSEETRLWKLKLKRLALILTGLLGIMGLYFITGDLGPAMVLGITFVVIYSMARRDSIHLIIGTAIYIILLFLCKWLFGGGKVYITVSAIWLIGWGLWGWLYKNRKQIFESAVVMNIIIAAFVLGSSSLSGDTGERMRDRTAMSMFGEGIWNNEVQGGDQVAQGLWGLASGGMTGQGLGKGNPNVIPAFHTDMILSSIGEELGWVCLLLIVVCLTSLIHRSWLIGRKAGKSFLFYLATGIAVVTGVQFLIISLGSTGIIPLTGITVPFLSSGMVSMIINVAAFGIVLSISKEREEKLSEAIKKEYDNKVIVPVLLTYFGLSIILLGRLFWCQGIKSESDDILIRPALVTDRTGDRIVEYNPRINILIRELGAANIRDRYGELLATSIRDSLNRYSGDKLISPYSNHEKQQFKRRYYPFGNQLIFWTGDFNNIQNPYFWNETRGYVAENRHLAELRGFQNRTYKTDSLKTNKYKLNRFLPEQPKKYEYEPRDYSELIPSLKAGIHSSETEKLRKKQKNIYLTVDARLQTEIQNAMSDFFQKGNYPTMRKLRASVVVLNARSGELLCSANYPLPNLDTLKIKPEIYNDIEGTRNYDFTRAYTDMDLGAAFSTPPGSTAKVISALAGFIKAGQRANSMIYNVDPVETIYSGEPGSAKNENVSMERAIVESSNIYFINLVNDLDLYEQLKDIYLPAGIGVDGIIPYLYENSISADREAKFLSAVEANRGRAIPQYEKYKEARAKKQYKKMNNADWGWAWGQGTMAATPLAMARAYSIVANNGNFVETQYVAGNKSEQKPVSSSDYTKILTKYMEEEAVAKGMTGIAAKTGTPERVTRIRKAGNRVYETIQNDGWFIFFRNSDAYHAPVTVAIRIERLDGGGSQRAVYLAKDLLNVITKRESEIKNKQ